MPGQFCYLVADECEISLVIAGKGNHFCIFNEFAVSGFAFGLILFGFSSQ